MAQSYVPGMSWSYVPPAAPKPAPAPAPVRSSGGGGSSTPAPVATTWTNIVTGQTTTSAGVPSGGSNAGWVPGTTAVGGAAPTPYVGTPSNPASAQPAVTVPAGYTPDPGGALMPVNPTPTTATPFQTNALTQAGATAAAYTTPLTQPTTAVEALTTAQELAKGTKEGDIRKNAETGNPETFTPAGVWEEVNVDSKISDVYAPKQEAVVSTKAVTQEGLVTPPATVDMADLRAAIAREQAGTTNKTDRDNLAYARSKKWIPAFTKTVGAVEEEQKIVEEKAKDTELTAEEILKQLGLESKSEAEYLAEAMDSPEFKWFMDKYNLKNTNVAAQAEAAKEMLDVKHAGDKSSLENKLASRGLAFSGIRASQVSGLAASLAASKLDVDRKMAIQVLDLDNTLMDKILDLVADKVKEASEGRKEALGMLEDMGMTINPLTKKFTPTLAARSAARLEAGQDFSQRLQLAQLENSSKSTIRKEWEDYIELGGTLGFDAYQTIDANRKRSVSVTNIITPQQQQSIEDIFNANRGNDKTSFNLNGEAGKGYVNTEVWKREYNKVKDKATFKANYSYLLNPNDATTGDLSIKPGNISAWEIDSEIWKNLADEWSGFSPEQQAQLIEESGRPPALFGLGGYSTVYR